MLVLSTILVLTTSNVSAKEYVADDSVTISSQYHDVFNNYFNESEKYTYFPYSCDYGNYNNRTCYFGIDEEGNYLDISYVSSGSSYVLNYSTGIDDDFNVTGSNVFIHYPSSTTIISYSIIFICLVLLFYILI